MDQIKHGKQFLYFQQGNYRSVDFALQFAEANAPTRPFACRLTGGCANMTAADGFGMNNLARALGGIGINGPRHHFAGFGLFGGTRMLSAYDPKTVIPGITEVFPTIRCDCPGMQMLGIIPGFRHFIRDHSPDMKDHLILEQSRNHTTIVHPDADAVLLLQALPGNEEVWDDEYKETFQCFRTLHERGWGTLNIAYNGGSVTEREIKLWAEWGKREPGFWNMLLIKDSGRMASKYSEDSQWLEKHPSIHVADNDAESIHHKLRELSAVVESAEVPNILRFQRKSG